LNPAKYDSNPFISSISWLIEITGTMQFIRSAIVIALAAFVTAAPAPVDLSVRECWKTAPGSIAERTPCKG
jgi:hypothetical protein